RRQWRPIPTLARCICAARDRSDARRNDCRGGKAAVIVARARTKRRPEPARRTAAVPTLPFIQLSDLHLGAAFAWLPPDRRAVRRREQCAALDAAIQAAIDRSAVAILLPGDLFDAEGVDAGTLAFAVHAFERPGCPPVFIAPG